jgi:hypothetical protein
MDGTRKRIKEETAKAIRKKIRESAEGPGVSIYDQLDAEAIKQRVGF